MVKCYSISESELASKYQTLKARYSELLEGYVAVKTRAAAWKACAKRQRTAYQEIFADNQRFDQQLEDMQAIKTRTDLAGYKAEAAAAAMLAELEAARKVVKAAQAWDKAKDDGGFFTARLHEAVLDYDAVVKR